VKAVVLVGGEGTRLRPLTYTTPKQLLPVVEIPLLERVLLHLAEGGVDEAILSLGYRPDAFAAAYPEAVAAGIKLAYAVEDTPLDTAGAIRFAALAGGVDDTFVAVNGDVLTDLDTAALVDFHRERGAVATIHLTAVEDPSRFGVVTTDDRGRVLAFVEKPPVGRAPSNLINAGTYVLEPEVLEAIPDGRPVSIERETFPQLAAAGRVFALASDDYWLDAGTPTAYLRAHADLLDGTRQGPPVPGARLLGDGVWAAGEARLEGEVRPFSFLGRGAVVAKGATVEGSVLGAGSRVEGGATVTRSVLLPDVTVRTGATVTASILGRGAVVGEECEVAETTVVGDGEVLDRGVRLHDARVPA
jgi:mannose-1-phosphate guanylyltransferase